MQVTQVAPSGVGEQPLLSGRIDPHRQFRLPRLMSLLGQACYAHRTYRSAGAGPLSDTTRLAGRSRPFPMQHMAHDLREPLFRGPPPDHGRLGYALTTVSVPSTEKPASVQSWMPSAYLRTWVYPARVSRLATAWLLLHAALEQ